MMCCLWRRWCSGRRVACLVVRAAWCARGRRPARESSAPRASLGASARSPVRPCCRPRAPQPGPAPRSPPVPSGPSGALHTGGTCVAWTSPARPCYRPPASQPGSAVPPAPSGNAAWPCWPCFQFHFTPSHRTLIAESTFNVACNSLTALSNHEFRLLELQRFQILLKLLPIELHATFLRPGPAAPTGSAAWRCVSRWARFLWCPPRRGRSRGLDERKIAPASHRVVVWGASVKEISPQHAENGRKLGILGVCGR